MKNRKLLPLSSTLKSDTFSASNSRVVGEKKETLLSPLLEPKTEKLTPQTTDTELAKMYNVSFQSVYQSILTNELKIEFLKALLTKNAEALSVVLQKCGHHDDFLKKTRQLFENHLGEVLHPYINFAIQSALKKEKKVNIIFLLGSTLQSISEFELSMHYKKELMPELLAQLSEDVAKSAQSQLTDLSYDPSLPSFRPSLENNDYLESKITLDEYTAVKGNIDISEFIILTIGLLKNCREKIPTHLLTELANDYLFARYEDAVNKIKAHCQARLTYFNSRQTVMNPLFKISPLENKIFTEVLAMSEVLTKFSPEKNNSRMFFETRLSQYITGLLIENKSELPDKKLEDESMRTSTLQAINKILAFYLGEEGKVTNPQEMEIKICIFAHGFKDTVKFPPDKIQAIEAQWSKYHQRDRVPRPKGDNIVERKFEISTKEVCDSVWNSSGGLLSNLSPTFLDEAIVPPLRNMLVDAARRPNQNKNIEQWSHLNNREYAAYAGSISAHTCKIIAMLTQYLEKNISDPNLNQDIHLFLIQQAAVYSKRGFHSMLEVMDVHHDKGLNILLNKYGVRLNLENYFLYNKPFGKHLEYAMNDTLAYTKTLALKHNVLSEIQQKKY